LKKPLILVDGSSYLFRAYYALPSLTNSKNQATGAIYGVANMLRRLLLDYQPELIAVVFDTKKPTFRHELYKEYKANRTKMPEELASQIAPLHELIRALGLPLIAQEGVEADDVIGTLALEAEREGLSVVISTGDKDMTQLVNQHVTCINTMTNQTLDIKGVEEKFGVPPEKIIDYLSLMGDSSDNIPGIPNVGPKTALKWLQEYGSLDNVVKNAENIKGKVGENLRENLDKLELSKTLVTIKTDVELSIKPSDLKLAAPDNEKLKHLFAEFEFKKWLEEVNNAAPLTSEPVVVAEQKFELILTKNAWQVWQKKLAAAQIIALDTETTSIEPMLAQIVGVSFSVKAGEAAYVPLMHDYVGAPTQLKKSEFLAELAPFLSDKNKTIVGQNLKYDIEILRHEGIEIKAPMRDTLLESYVINSTGSRHDLETLAKNNLNRSSISFEEIAGKGAKQLTFNQIELDIALNYAAEDADIALQIDQKLFAQIKAEPAYSSVFNEIEMPLMPILAQMEYTGVLIDAKKLAQQSAELAKKIDQFQEQAYELAGQPFNLGSPKQLQEILYNKMQIPVLKKTPGGQPSTAEPVLQDLAHSYELPAVILQYRSLAKLKSTYTDALPEQINLRTGRVHTSYNQAVTATGRLSSNNPNLQNIPTRTEEGRKIREAFIAPRGYKIVAADYSQIELRIVAHLSQDPGLLKAFKHNQDVHASTAAEVFSVALDKVTKDQRRIAKMINFGLLYGMSAFGLSRQLGISRTEAQQHMDVYFKRYPGVHGYMQHAREIAAKQGYVETLFKRRLYIPEINSTNKQMQLAAERAAINAPMQGTAADLIKIAMIHVDAWLRAEQIDAKMIMQVHDELVFEVKVDHIEKISAKIKSLMENAASLSVPLIVDVGVGDNWGEAH